MAKNESKPKLTFMHFIAAAALLSIIEPALILVGVLSPILSYSPGNLVFSILKLVVITYYGIYFSDLGLKRCALLGAIVAAISCWIAGRAASTR